MMNCDPAAGVCMIPDAVAPPAPVPARADGAAVRYIGDPMCSWCWGISPTVSALASFCAAEGIAFSLTVGGLRAGGGDPWNDAFKGFLRNEWRHIGEITGQPFGFSLLDAQHFDYDTEPACRAVVTAQMLAASTGLPASTALDFFSATQRRFYVDGRDPKDVAFYADICADVGLDFAAFQSAFASAAAAEATRQAFAHVRQWGVRSFPTLLIEHAGRRTPLAVGFVTTEQAIGRLRQTLAMPADIG